MPPSFRGVISVAFGAVDQPGFDTGKIQFHLDWLIAADQFCPWPDSNRRHPPLAMVHPPIAMVRTFFPTELQGRIYPVFPGMCEFQKDLLAILFAQKRKPQIQTFKRRRIIHLSFYSNLFLSAQTWPPGLESNQALHLPDDLSGGKGCLPLPPLERR